MAEPTIDTNQWYHFYVNENKQESLHGSSLSFGRGTKGPVLVNSTDLALDPQRWQIFPVMLNSTKYYALRCNESGPNAFMGVGYDSREILPGKTRPQLLRGDVLRDDGIFWSFGSWNDGTWFLSNAANTTKYNLNKKNDGILAMDEDITAPQNGQRWQFEGIAKIDDLKYSSVTLQNVMTTVTSSLATPQSSTAVTATGPSPSSRSEDTSNDKSSSGLSRGAKAGIGAAVCCVLLIALLALGWYLYKKRPRAQPSTYELPPDTANQNYYQDNLVKHEMSSKHPSEMPNTERPAELPGHMPGKR